jgi:hypothetical protein
MALVSAVLNVHVLLAQSYIFKSVCAFFQAYMFTISEKLAI